jgi:guanine deaminase
MSTDERWLQQAVDLAVANVAAGGGPFGAVVVKDGELVATGQNRVTADLDPTAHAEVQAIRAAARAIGDFSLAGCVLYTSCEPCPMCLASSLWARLDRVVYAADRHDAADGGFDDREFYELFARDRTTWATRVDALPLPHPTAPFDAWLAKSDRIDY